MSAPSSLHPAEHLHAFCRDVFERLGVPARDATTAADVLLSADLRGVDSHGVARLHTYVGLLREERINPKPDVRIVHRSPSTACVDGDRGLGLVVGPVASSIAMQLAEEHGSGWVAVRNSNHYGIAGWHALQAVERDLIGWSMTNSTPLVAAAGGRDRMLGTNPIAVAFPALEEPPVVIDMATSAVAYGKVEMAARRGEEIPRGWSLDPEGRDTTRPEEVLAEGALLPLGSSAETSEHKGTCLGALVDLLCGPLSGAAWGPFTEPFDVGQRRPTRRVGEGIGHFFGALRIDGFRDAEEFKRSVDDWCRTLRAGRPRPDGAAPRVPGDPEREEEARRRKEGVPLLPAVVESLRRVAEQTGATFE